MSQQAPNAENVLAFSTIFSRSLMIYKLAFKRLFIVGFVMACLDQFAFLYLSQFLPISTDKPIPAGSGLLFLVIIVIALLIMLLNAIMFMLCAGAQLGRSVKLKYLIAHIKQCLLALFLANIVYSVAVNGGLYLFVVPGILAMAFFYIYLPIILLDGASSMASLQQSFRLVRPYLWRVLPFVLISFMLLSMKQYLMFKLSENAGPTLSASDFGIEEVIGVFVVAFIYPFIISLCLQVYFALKRLSAGL